MIWTKARRPQRGDVRFRTGFLWIPLDIEGVTRWMETAEWTEMWRSGARIGAGYGRGSRWVTVCWGRNADHRVIQRYQNPPSACSRQRIVAARKS